MKKVYNLLLALASTSPMILIFTVNAQIVILPALQLWLSYLFILFCVIIINSISIFLFRFLSQDSIEGQLKDIELANSSFLPNYLGYFFVAVSITNQNTFILVYALSVLLVMLSQSMYYNPFLLIFRYNFYHATGENGTRIFLITKSEKPYFLDWLGRPFVSVDYDQMSALDGKRIDYICAYQDGNLYCFQKIAKSHYLSKHMFISIGDEFSLESDKTFLIINETPDAIYLKGQDILLFRSLPTITSIFKGIDILYREATETETIQFLCRSFIALRDGFSVRKVSKPNRHRISMAMDTMEKFDATQKQEVITYIQGYCPTLSCQNGAFSIGTDNELKLLLYGIEQRYHTTVITREKRLANSILAMDV